MVNSQDDLRSLATLQQPSALRFVFPPLPSCAHVSFQQATGASYYPDSTLSVSDAPYSTPFHANLDQVRSYISNRAQHDDAGTYRTSSRTWPFAQVGTAVSDIEAESPLRKGVTIVQSAYCPCYRFWAQTLDRHPSGRTHYR